MFIVKIMVLKVVFIVMNKLPVLMVELEGSDKCKTFFLTK